MSCVFTGFCPSATQNSQAWLKLSSLVFMPGDISTSFISCAGRQKCMPTKRSSRPLPPAISVMEMVEVFDANRVCGGHTALSLPNSSCLTAKSSNTASMTMSQSAMSARSVVPDQFAMICSSCSCSSFLRCTDFSRKARVCSLALSSAGCRVSYTRVRKPARAATMAIPAPMVPLPATPTVLIVFMLNSYFKRKLRPISCRWTWLVPSQICVILASRIRRSTR